MNIYLIGYRGCGKSTVAPLVAAKLGWSPVDVDHQIQVIANKSVAEIFADDGEAAFRQLETKAVKQIAREANKVVSLGGGAPMVEMNRQTMAATGRTVWLTASAEELWRRICADPDTVSTRPRLSDLDGLSEVIMILRQRNDVYEACADYTINTQRLTPDQIAVSIVQWFNPVDK